MTVVDPVPIEVGRPMVLLRLGYRRPSQVPAKVSGLIEEVMEQGRARLAPKAVHREVAVEAPAADRVILGTTLQVTSRSVHERFARCRTAFVFAATIGPALEEWGQALLDAEELTRALLVDAFGSAAATALGMKIEELASRSFQERGLQATKRYAPGYGDWDLADQAPLLSLLDAGRIGIVLTEDHLMLPAKSISGVVGGAPAGEPSAADSTGS